MTRKKQILGLLLWAASAVAAGDINQHWQQLGLKSTAIKAKIKNALCYQSPATFHGCVAVSEALASKAGLQLLPEASLQKMADFSGMVAKFPGAVLMREPTTGSAVVWGSPVYRLSTRHLPAWSKLYQETRKEAAVPFDFEAAMNVLFPLVPTEEEATAVPLALNAWYATVYGDHTKVVPTTMLKQKKAQAHHRAQPLPNRMIEGEAFLTISEFTAETCNKVKKQLIAWKTLGLKSLIMDLRENQGGDFQAAVCVADLFLEPRQVIVRRPDPAGLAVDFEWRSQKPAEVDVPMVALIDWGTEREAEVVAAALQDTKRAYLVGNVSMGAGVQTVEKTYGEKLQVSIALREYFRDGGFSIQYVGVQPDFRASRSFWGELSPIVRERDLYSVVPRLREWQQPRQTQINELDRCRRRSGKSEPLFNDFEARAKQDYQMVFAKDIISCQLNPKQTGSDDRFGR